MHKGIKRLISVAFFGALSLVLGLKAYASFEARPLSKAELGTEIYYYNYEEPNFAELEGVYYGLNGAYTYRPTTIDLAIKGEVRFAWGNVDYTSNGTGSADGIDDFVVEPRAWIGYDLAFAGGTFTPFFGIGFRYLEDNQGGVVTSSGAKGYDRSSQYLYSPIGAEFNQNLGGGWDVTLAAEYDIFWDGTQESQLSDAIAGLSDVTNDQNSGDGVRVSAQFVKKMQGFNLAIEPFFRYWLVEDSTTSPVTFQGVAVGYGLEPENQTYEAGVKIAFIY